jgi:predicted phage tail protein
MLRRIKVYGPLAKFLGQRSFEADVKSPAEAVRFLLANFPKLEAHMIEHHYKVSVGRFELEAGSEPDQLTLPAPMAEPIRIVPVVAGAGATGRIIAGVALIALSFALPGAQLGLFGLGQIGLTALAAPVLAVGASLALSGVAQLLTPTPRQTQTGQDSFNDPRKSYSFSGIQNVSRQGVPVPIVYGETVVGSVTISAGINTEEVPV